MAVADGHPVLDGARGVFLGGAAVLAAGGNGVGGRLVGGKNRGQERTGKSHDFPAENLEGGMRGRTVSVLKEDFKCLGANGLQVNPSKSNRHNKMISGSMASFNGPCGRALIDFTARKAAGGCRTPRRWRVDGGAMDVSMMLEIRVRTFEERPMKTRKLSQIKPNKTKFGFDAVRPLNFKRLMKKIENEDEKEDERNGASCKSK
ncbi:MAG TPA: hypothetical protein VG347_03245 [Verrucomicrobiae bacterium]|nr:hypothetical protein [Verrucomicrobiae bacterium]